MHVFAFPVIIIEYMGSLKSEYFGDSNHFAKIGFCVVILRLPDSQKIFGVVHVI